MPTTKATRALLILGMATACLTVPVRVDASGSYTARPPQPGASSRLMDRAKYSLGQRLFDGKIKPDASADATAQTERLKRLQAALPKRVAAKKDLPAMAGKLTAEQLEAIEYFVNRRYGK